MDLRACVKDLGEIVVALFLVVRGKVLMEILALVSLFSYGVSRRSWGAMCEFLLRA